MNISKDAIEAAAEVLHDLHEEALWRHQIDAAKAGYRNDARAALEAAAPLLVAQTLREAADDAFNDKSAQGLARAVIGNWLRKKATKIEERP